MKLEINSNQITGDFRVTLPTGWAFKVPPLRDEDYWLMRVPISDNQAVICFPKFGGIGIGFQHEEYWNIDLPYTSDPGVIFRHISGNKGDDSISDEDCIEAIKLLQEAIEEQLEARKQDA